MQQRCRCDPIWCALCQHNLACHVTLLLQEIATLLVDDTLVMVMLTDETLMTCVSLALQSTYIGMQGRP
jgi:hypothetical protein